LNRVIKSMLPNRSNSAAPLLLRPDAFLNETGEVDAQDVVTRAKQQVEIIIRTAQAEARGLRDSAYTEGYSAGVQAAADAGAALLATLEQAIADETEERANLVRSIEEQALMLCVDTAEKVIRHEVRTDPGIVARALKLCLRRVRDRDEVTVRVGPREVAAIREMRDELLGSAEGLRGMSIVDDRRISAGGCIVESSSGDFDARIETQVDQIRRKLMDAFHNEFSKSDPEPVEIPRDDQPDGHGTG
jgi:flagellar assembly protein FliH